MTLARKLALHISVLVSCTALVGVLALVGLQSVSRHFNAAEQQYQELRSLYEIGHRMATLRMLVTSGHLDRESAQILVQRALAETRTLLQSPGRNATRSAARFTTEVNTLQKHLEHIAGLLSSDDLHAPTMTEPLNAGLARITTLAGSTEQQIMANRRAATDRFRAVLAGLAGVVILSLIAAAFIGWRQHRSVMKPLNTLAGGIKRISDANFHTRLPQRGEQEYRQLIGHFNQMAQEIEHLHTHMQREIETKSRQLVRSEQLAAVGHLAAGLAHEINNPLGILSGYAQTARKRLHKQINDVHDPQLAERLQQALDIICEESFRCRDITNQLLDMAQPGSEQRGPVRLDELAQRTADMLVGLSMFRERRLDVHVDQPADQLVVTAAEAELTQVMINLMTNALEAIEPTRGKVVVAITRHDDQIIMRVEDNGCGMSETAIAKAFDPFYTDKPKRGLSGSGLGLAVSHAIVERHGGQLTAHSDGPNTGSAFTMTLPARVEAETPVHV